LRVDGGDELDLAIIGGGAAGTRVAYAMKEARRDWSIALFERTERIGGRLRSVRVDGLDHPIELGGMRYLTDQPRVRGLVEAFQLRTHPFDPTGAHERRLLRGVASTPDDTDAGSGYDLPPSERGRSPLAMALDAFERIVPGFQDLDHDGFAERRATGRYMDRRLIDWSIGDALATVLSPEGQRFVTDAFGYDSGMRAFTAPDLIEFLFGGGDPNAEARTPDDGMDRIPQEQAARFEIAGGTVRLGHELDALTVNDDAVGLRFANGFVARARNAVLTVPVPALRRIMSTSPVLRSESYNRLVDSVEGFPAMKLYLWYDAPWWRPSVAGIRTTTDLPIRKVFYFDGSGGSRSAMLAMYTDGLDVRPWAELYQGAPPGAPAPPEMLAAVQDALVATHPDVGEIPSPAGSALMYWGADPLEVAWHFWRPGAISDEMIALTPQPDGALPVYLATEAFSRRQSWVEGALEAADAAVARLVPLEVTKR
jgi:lysine 2-monooxygenase